MEILVTGANGYSGQRIITRLLDLDHTIWALARDSNSSSISRTNDNLNWVEADLLNPVGLPSKIDAVIHTAASLGVPGVSINDIVRNNVEASRVLIQYALTANARSFIYFSAMSVYGAVETNEVTETTPIIDPNPYGMSKLLGEQMLAEISQQLPSTSLRLPAIIGPGSTHAWLDRARENIKAGETVNFVNPDNQFNNLVHVDELADFVSRLISTDQEDAGVYVLGATSSLPIGELINNMIRELKSNSIVNAQIDPSAPAFTINCAKAENDLGWAPQNIVESVDNYIAENSS